MERYHIFLYKDVRKTNRFQKHTARGCDSDPSDMRYRVIVGMMKSMEVFGLITGLGRQTCTCPSDTGESDNSSTDNRLLTRGADGEIFGLGDIARTFNAR